LHRTYRAALSSLALLVVTTIAFPQVQWVQRFPATNPPARHQYALAYDSARGRTVLFGGTIPGNPQAGFSDSWEWDGVNWTQRFPLTSPPARGGHALAFDSARGRTVLFGGTENVSGGYSGMADTWEWDGTNWYPLSPATSPCGRYYHGLAYDSMRRRTVLFGGHAYGTPCLGGPAGARDTWEWDGANWQPTSSVGPPGRAGVPLAYDSRRGRVVLFGGGTTYAQFLDTWEYDGTWVQRFPATTPQLRETCRIAYDSTRDRIVLCPHATWEWDGADWYRPCVASGSSWFGVMAYDSIRRRVVCFSESTTWEYGVGPCGVVGPGHSGCGLPFNCVTQPQIGSPFCVSFSDGSPAGFNLLLVAPGAHQSPPFPLPPPDVCAPASIYPAGPPLVVLQATGNPAAFCIVIPGEPALASAVFTLQGAALELSGCFRVTDGLGVSIQS